jgi:hypothetical protein
MCSRQFAWIGIALACLGILSGGSVGSAPMSQEPQITLQTLPLENQILPFEAEAETPTPPVQITLQLARQVGKLPEPARIHFQIQTPQPNVWLPTDFPVVEGTQLLDIETALPLDGKWQLLQSLPVRGIYHLTVNIEPLLSNSFKPITRTLSLSVNENLVKFRNFAILATFLLTCGFGGGLVIGGAPRQNSGEIAPMRVRLLLSAAAVVAILALLVINFEAEFAESHAHTHTQPHQEVPFVYASGFIVEWSALTQATVGQPAAIALHISDAKNRKPVQDIEAHVRVVQAEEGWVALAFWAKPNRDGWLRWKQGFFDGAPHKLEIEIAPDSLRNDQFKPFRFTREIDVESVAPPLATRAIGFFYFSIFLVAGLLGGLWIRGRQARKDTPLR